MKRLTFILLTFIGFSVFAQKSEVKSAEKAYKKGDIDTAQTMIKKACKLKDQADDKTKARIMFVKAQILAKQGASDLDNYRKALKAIRKLKAFEREIGKKRYTKDANNLKAQISNEVLNVVNDDLSKKNYKELEKSAMIAYNLKKDDEYKYFAAVAALVNENYENAKKLLKELYDSGYTGVTEYVSMIDKSTGKRVNVGSEKQAKLLEMAGTHTDMKKEKTKSRRPDIIAKLLYVYGKLGKDEDAINFINNAKKEDPNNLDLIIGEGNYYLKKGDNEKFAATMQKAVELDPKNKILNYNLAIGYKELKKYDEAKKYFEKAIELDPKFTDAYLGLVEITLVPAKAIGEELNKEEVLANEKLYNKYNNQLMDIYRKVLPYFEKILEINPDDQTTMKKLKTIYRELDMMDKYKEIKAKLDAMGGK